MKYEKIIKIAIGVVAVAALFVVPMITSAAGMVAPTITSVAGDDLINLVEKTAPGFPVVFSMTNTGTTTTSWISINVANANNANSATTTLQLGGGATTTSITVIPNALLADGAVTVSLYWADGIATTTVATRSATLDTVAPTVSAIGISSNNSSTTLAKVGDAITLTATTSEDLSAPSLVTAATFLSGGNAIVGAPTFVHYNTDVYKFSYTANSGDTNGAVTFSLGSFTDPAGNPVASTYTTLIPSSGTGVTFDKTAPTITSVTWNDVDGSTEINAGDTVAVVFSEGMATSTATTTSLGLSAHTFGNSTLAWTVGTTTLTITLGSTATIVSGDTINPTNATDFVGNAYSTATHAITDSTGPVTPVASLATNTYSSTQTTTLTSTGSSHIYYTVDGSTPTCSSHLYNGNFVIIDHSLTLKAVGCDAYSNVTATPLSVDYVIGGSGGVAGGGGGWSPSVAVSAIPVASVVPVVPSGVFSHGALSRDLSVGSEGNDVADLQTYLESNGYLVMPNGVAKGYFGGITKKAVIKFQKAVGLPTPGRVGPMTRNILNQGQ